MKVIIIGAGSGLGNELLKELEKKKDVYAFTSKDILNDKYFKLDLNNFNQKYFEDCLEKIKNFDEVYYLSNFSKYENFLDIKPENLANYFNFNFLNFSLIIQSILKKNEKVNIKLILSHINFMFNSNFEIYRAQKIFQKTLMDNLQIQNKDLKVDYFYPGAMDTNFVKNNSYSGLSIFKKQNPNEIAKKIILGRKIFKYSDWFLYFFYNIFPNRFVIFFYKFIIKIFPKN